MIQLAHRTGFVWNGDGFPTGRLLQTIFFVSVLSNEEEEDGAGVSVFNQWRNYDGSQTFHERYRDDSEN